MVWVFHLRFPFWQTVIYTFLSPLAVLFAFLVEDRSPGFFMPKRTFQPNRRRRSKTHGFRTRMKTKSGRAVISRRRAKGRKRVSAKPGFRAQWLSSSQQCGSLVTKGLATLVFATLVCGNNCARSATACR